MGLANWLTIVRILLIPVFVSLIVYDRIALALATFVLAGLTDMLDGYIARTRGTKTRLGAFLDPLADKLLLTASFVTLTYRYPWLLPFWLTAIVLSRDVILVLVAGLVMLTGGQVYPAPTMLGKTSTALQMVAVVAAILGAAGLELAGLLRVSLNVGTAALTIASGVQYLVLAPRFVEWGPRG
jgi:cardiolipin synthase